MKKSLIAGIIFGVLFISMINFASANIGTSVTGFLDNAAEVLKPIFAYTLGDPGGDGTTLFVKVLLFILMLAVLYYAVSKVPMFSENEFVIWTIAIVAAILGARIISSQAWVDAIWLPSGVLGVALTSLIPFIIYFFFIQSFSGHRIIRVTGWVLFILIFVVLAVTRWGSFEEKIGTAGVTFNLAWIYIATIVLALLSLLFDKKIQTEKEKMGRKKKENVHYIMTSSKLNEELSAMIDTQSTLDPKSSKWKTLEEAIDNKRKAIAKYEEKMAEQ